MRISQSYIVLLVMAGHYVLSAFVGDTPVSDGDVYSMVMLGALYIGACVKEGNNDG